ncbi:MAG TPA: hypothetical protein DCE42_19225 [Myxococcales bacterium]|nr:hypothetical protein [Deltaproteobacteria bacterium]MBU51606.1 hypothetical protein [Deltaproteobacteria bacterium]HAA56907.1 hypothetical protein [Myxococcales bacterium]|tara:strand:+ start:9820 stop:11238 length:1419 start_codon:yes stop_codon:yes gene_type:complete
MFRGVSSFVESHVSTESPFVSLRRIFHLQPSADVWDELIALFSRWEREHQALLDALVDYAEPHLQDWPYHLCVLPKDWTGRILDGDNNPLWRLGRSLYFRGTSVSIRDLDTLFAHDLLGQVEELNFCNCRLGEPLMVALTSSRMLKQIRSLELGHNGIGSRGLGLLLAHEDLQKLERIGLAHSYFLLPGEYHLRDLEHFAAPNSLEKVIELDLDDNPFGLDKLKYLADCPALQHLEVLSLRRCAMGDEELMWLLDKPFPALKTVRLDEHFLTPASKELIEQSWLSEVIKSPRDAQFYVNRETSRQSDYWFLRGLSVLRDNEHEELVVAYNNRAIEWNADELLAYNNRGDALRGMGRFEEAIDDFRFCLEQANEVDINRHLYACNLAQCYYQIGLFEEAVEAFLHSIQVHPLYATAHYDLACCYARLGEFPKALSALRRAVDLDATYRVAARKDDDFDGLRVLPAFSLLVGER